MPTPTKYTFSISGDFSNGVATDRLQKEIRDSAIVIAIDRIDTAGDDCDVWFRDSLSESDEMLLTSLVGAHTGEPLPQPVQEVFLQGVRASVEGHLKTQIEPRYGTEKYFYTPNLCDPCSWYHGSAIVSEVPATDSGDLTTWTTGHVNWIDLKHGRLFREDSLFGVSDYYIQVETSPDGETWTPRQENSWNLEDGEFTFNYETGSITFNAALDPGTLVRVSGRKANSSLYIMEPDPGKRLKLEYVEIQYTTDIEMYHDLIFEIRVYAAVVAQFDETIAYYLSLGIIQPTDRIPVVSERYKKIQNFFEESTGPFPIIPAHGGQVHVEEIVGVSNIEDKKNDGWKILGTRYEGGDWIALMQTCVGERALRSDLITIPFQYLAFRDLRSSWGMQVCVAVDGDEALPGQFATVTLYATTEDE